MPRTLDQRYVPTDLRSQVLHFLWSVGFDRQDDRALLAKVILDLRDFRQQQCESANSMISSKVLREER